MSKLGYIAFDLGAESGRAMLGVLEHGKLTLTETHRFANRLQQLPSGYHWSLMDLWGNLLEGLKKAGDAARSQGVELRSLGVDTWGVDFGILGKSGDLLGLPHAYRDPRNEPAMAATLDKLGEQSIYAATGIQFMPFNTLFQLVAVHDAEPDLLPLADRMLNIPDLLHYFFTGQAVNEATIASTTQMIDPRTGKWATELLTSLGIPTSMLQPTTPAGTPIGNLRDAIASECNVPAMQVIVPGSHDTASAVAAVPVAKSAGDRWAYLSSGTWSLMGAELDKPIVTDASRAAGFTNERGVADKIRFLKNISGLWLVQECRRDFARNGNDFNYQQLTDLADQAAPFRTLVDPNHAPFSKPGDMPAKITAFAEATNQPAPETPGAFVRCCLESLALTYRDVLINLESLLGKPMEVLHIVGGGGQNRLLNQMTADAIGRTVVVGPFEATAVGNALTQAIGDGQIADLAGLRQVVIDSFEPETYKPQNADAWTNEYKRYLGVVGK